MDGLGNVFPFSNGTLAERQENEKNLTYTRPSLSVCSLNNVLKVSRVSPQELDSIVSILCAIK